MRKRRYKVNELLGRGGFGSVYKAEKLGEEGFSTIVAIKLLHAMGGGTNPELDKARSDAVRRLRDEARLLGLLKHRSIVQVFDLERLRGQWAIVMEYVNGMQLAELVEQTRVPVRQALAIVEEVADALHTAYHFKPHDRELHLLHRDIKPSNVMITQGGSVKVLDFGIARANFAARETRTAGFLVGTQRYMSPEHLDFDDDTILVGPESDIYSLGAVLFELVAGQPFGRATLDPLGHQDKIVAQLDEHVLGRVPRALYDLLKRMLSYSPAERPTARELRSVCERLQQELRGEGLRSWCERVVGPLERNRRRSSRPARDPIIGTILEEGSIPEDAFLEEHDRTVVAKSAPAGPDDGRTWGETPQGVPTPGYTPTARASHPGAIALDGERDGLVSTPLGIDSPIGGPDVEISGAGIGIAIDGQSPYDDRPPRRARSEASRETPGRRRLVLLGAGLGALAMLVVGIWVITMAVDRKEQGETEIQQPPAVVADADPSEAPEVEADASGPLEVGATEAPAVESDPVRATAGQQAVSSEPPNTGRSQVESPSEPVAAAAPVPQPPPESAPSTSPAPVPETGPAGTDARLAAIASLRGGGDPASDPEDGAESEAPSGDVDPDPGSPTVAGAEEPTPESELESAPEIPPEPPAPSSYRVQGNALEVYLKSGSRRYDAGAEIEAGRYDIWARFDKSPGASAIRVGVARIGPGQVVTIDCDAGLALCRPL